MADYSNWAVAKCPKSSGSHEVSAVEEMRYQEVLDDRGNAFQAPMKTCIHCESTVILERPTPISTDQLSSVLMRKRAGQLSGQP